MSIDIQIFANRLWVFIIGWFALSSMRKAFMMNDDSCEFLFVRLSFRYHVWYFRYNDNFISYIDPTRFKGILALYWLYRWMKHDIIGRYDIWHRFLAKNMNYFYCFFHIFHICFKMTKIQMTKIEDVLKSSYIFNWRILWLIFIF